VGRIIIVTLLWSEIMGRYNGRDRSVKVGHEIRLIQWVPMGELVLLH